MAAYGFKTREFDMIGLRQIRRSLVYHFPEADLLHVNVCV